MKKFFFISISAFCTLSSFAQKCLQLNIAPLMSNLQVPGSSANSFAKCATKTNDHGQIEFINYGSDLEQLDTIVARNSRDFNNASVTNMGNMQLPSSQNVDAAKQLAEQLKNMTPEQQKAWAMQQAQQQMANASHPIQDDGATAKLVMQTNDMAVNQLGALNRELAAKMREIMEASSKEKETVKLDNSSCPGLKPVGLPSCACVNALAGKYWDKIISIEDKYNAQRIALLQQYIPRIKAITSTVDDNIAKLQYGDAVKSPQLKQMLFSAQSSAFGNSFSLTTASIEDIRKESSNIFAHKKNADNQVENLSCQK
ncbi:MAG: hypothetical protein JST87_15030 [Bacteroidetes bacterium]|nr:hypothetical protein [Bacteroidota bacterium]